MAERDKKECLVLYLTSEGQRKSYQNYYGYSVVQLANMIGNNWHTLDIDVFDYFDHDRINPIASRINGRWSY